MNERATPTGDQRSSTVPRGPLSPAQWVAVAVVAGLAIALALVLLPSVWPARSALGPASDFTLRSIDGDGTVRLSTYRGRPVVVNFWASWCAPCEEEAATIAETARRWRERGVVFIGVNSQDRSTAARRFVRDHAIDYENVSDPTGKVMRSFGVTGLPETFFIDARGVIRARGIGAMDATALERSLATIAAPAAQP